MPGQLYGRWAPPKISKQKTSPPEAKSPPGSIDPLPTQKETPKKGRDAIAPTVEVEASKSVKKLKKRKRESDVENGDLEAETTPKKHKSIFSKFDKVARRAEARENEEAIDQAGDEQDKQEIQPDKVLRDLEPLPQPAPVPDTAFEPTFSVLPKWLAQPVTVGDSNHIPFSELGVEPFLLKKLEKQGYTEALAVQSALLPMLHPGYKQHLGDICVSAKTGSGKTLAYLLPIIGALKDRLTPLLSAIVVVPSRQLVDQALQIAEELCAGTKLKVGTAVGSVSLATEQKQLVKVRAQYDPSRAKELLQRAEHQSATGFVERNGIMKDLMNMPIDHIPRYDSGVDILICTPGRLVEHIESTTGFLLRSVRWLVIDEADQLLNQNFQGWANVLMDTLHGETPDDFMDAQERLRRQTKASTWGGVIPARRQITKIVLSATMEKDLTKLGTLRLKRPKLVTVQDEPDVEHPTATDENIFELPSKLEESAVSVGDGQKKPLYLLYLLLNYVFKAPNEEESSPDPSNQILSIADHKSRVLVFTKSNESASRLAHLLSALEPSLKDYLKAMTPSSTAKAAKKLRKSLESGDVKIVIASDAASRGLDIKGMSHVINYDIPTSITSYIHRVGRTARGQYSGEAWTLFTKTEAAWFWKQIARGDSIRRGGKVKRVEWKEWNVTYNRKRTYDAALAELQEAVEGAEAA